jgi:hypothetical protein
LAIVPARAAKVPAESRTARAQSMGLPQRLRGTVSVAVRKIVARLGCRLMSAILRTTETRSW